MSSTGQHAVRVRDAEENLRNFLLRAVKTTPDRPAVIERNPDGDFTAVTYRDLCDRTDAYAGRLAELGLDVGDRVIVESDVDSHAVALLLACWTLGLSVIPVSPQTPAKRLLSIIGTAEPALFLQSADGRREDLPGPLGTARFGAGGLRVTRHPAPRDRHRHDVLATDTAYIIFTSGTTGRPKGVVMSHRAVIALLRAVIGERLLTAEDRLATTSPLQFDFALFDIGYTLGTGATLVPVPRTELNWPRRFLTFLDEAGVTQADGVPSIWRSALRHEPEQLAGLRRLRSVLFSGEEFPLPELRRMQQLLPGVRFINCYGATESMACSFTEVPNPLPDETERLSIGYPLPGFDITLLDADGRPVEEPGVEGQIHLRAPSLFTGYWDDPEATARALVPDPLDPRSGRRVLCSGDLAHRGTGGELYYRGRTDSQVQLRGNRVELKEVERRLLEFPGISAAVALVLPRPGQDPVLYAFVVLESPGSDLDKSKLRAFCGDTLPAYMIPHDIVAVDEIPLTVNGKADRAALAARVVDRP